MNYEIIHYYPNKTTLEFINIGVIGYSSNFFSFRLLDEEIEHLNCSFINIKALMGTVELLKSKLQNCKGIKELARSDMYFDDFGFSKTMLTKVYGDYQKELDSVYGDFISYKFEKPKIVHDRREEIKLLSKEIIKKEFKGSVSFMENPYFDFVLNIKDGKKIKQYPTIIGSLFNSADTSRALRLLIETDITKGIYGYINHTEEIIRHSKVAKKTLSILEEKLNFNAKNFSNENTIIDSIATLAA